MTDFGAYYTDTEFDNLRRKIHGVYSEAYRDIDSKLKDFNERYKAKEAKHLRELAEGKITQEQYNSWVNGQVFQGQRWQAKKDSIARVLYNANTTAANMVNNQSANVFAQNGNYMGYMLEHGAGVNFGFGLYDENTVKRLLVSDPQLLPEWKIDEKKDYTWNYKGLQNAVLQGTIQGERLDQISNRIARSMAMRNENTAKTFARTAMTGAQNAGRQYRLEEARSKGVNVKKEWMATLDSHTRDSHADVDGEVVDVDKKFSNGLEYPGEPGGAPAEVYNCRCTMVADLVDYPSEYKRYDNINGEPIDNMTYREWENAKKGASSLDIDRLSNSWSNGIANKNIQKGIERVAFLQQISNDEARQLLDNSIRDIVNNSEVGVALSQDSLIRALDEGSFKNVFETGTSTYNTNTKFRVEAEQLMFGINNSNTNPQDKPIYGALMPRLDQGLRAENYYAYGPIAKYGDGVTVVFDKQKIIESSTLTFGDSLNYANRIGVTTLKDPKYVGTYNIGATIDISRGASLMDVADKLDHYCEVQIHGESSHSTKNISYIVISNSRVKNADELTILLESRGVNVKRIK